MHKFYNFRLMTTRRKWAQSPWARSFPAALSWCLMALCIAIPFLFADPGLAGTHQRLLLHPAGAPHESVRFAAAMEGAAQDEQDACHPVEPDESPHDVPGGLQALDEALIRKARENRALQTGLSFLLAQQAAPASASSAEVSGFHPPVALSRYPVFLFTDLPPPFSA